MIRRSRSAALVLSLSSILALGLSACAGGGSGTPISRPPSQATTFERWNSAAVFTPKGSADSAIYTTALPLSVVTFASQPFPEVTVEARYGATRNLQGLTLTPGTNPPVVFGAAGDSFSTLSAEPAIDVITRARVSGITAFLADAPNGVVLSANPFRLGWEFQSFGVWDDASTRQIHAATFGAQTPASAVPTTGSAVFTGKLAGLYLSPTRQTNVVAANVSVSADFTSRILHFSSSSTQISTSAGGLAVAAPLLNLTGTLAYVAGSSAFSGTMSNAGNTMSGRSSGRFYGPTAQELGGSFVLIPNSGTSPETFIGAYGAKR